MAFKTDGGGGQSPKYASIGPVNTGLKADPNWLKKFNPQAELSAIDRDRNGTISQDELLKSQMVPPRTSEQQKLAEVFWKAAFAQADKQTAGMVPGVTFGDGELDLKEFEDLVANHGVDGEFTFESQTYRLLYDNPYVQKLLNDVQVGDLVFVQGSGLVADATQGDWTHVALCTKQGPPPEFVEAVGMTGSASSRGVVRHSDFLQFISDTDLAIGDKPKFAIVRPTGDPDQIAAAVRYAEEQIGKPYDFAFSDKNDSFYCSELVYRAFNENPHMPKGAPKLLDLKSSPERDAYIAQAKGGMLALGLNEEHVGSAINDYNNGNPLKAIGKLVGAIAGAQLGNTKPNVSFEFVSPILLFEGNAKTTVATYAP